MRNMHGKRIAFALACVLIVSAFSNIIFSTEEFLKASLTTSLTYKLINASSGNTIIAKTEHSFRLPINGHYQIIPVIDENASDYNFTFTSLNTDCLLRSSLLILARALCISDLSKFVIVPAI